MKKILETLNKHRNTRTLIDFPDSKHEHLNKRIEYKGRIATHVFQPCIQAAYNMN